MYYLKKICTSCEEEKFSTLDFSPSKSICKNCNAEKSREYRSRLGSDSKMKWGRFQMARKNNVLGEEVN